MSGGDWPFSLLESTFGSGFLINNLIMCMAMTNIVGACVMMGVVGTVMCMVFMIAAADAALDGNDALEQYYGLLAVLSLAGAFFSFNQAMKEAGITAEQLAVAKENAATNTNVDVDHTSVPPTSGGSGGTAGNSVGKGSSKTGTVWDNITSTQQNYPNSNIPRSFEIEVNGQKMWVHGNATEHIYEDLYAKILAGEGTAYTNPNLYTQQLLSDFHGSLSQATASGIIYGEKISAGNWEFIFATPRQEGLLPVIKHAQFKGW